MVWRIRICICYHQDLPDYGLDYLRSRYVAIALKSYPSISPHTRTVIDLGGGPNHDRIGFRYWQNPGAVNSYLVEGGLGRFLAIAGTVVQAAFSYSGLELVAITASETQSPRRNVAKAVQRVFWRCVSSKSFTVQVLTG